MRGRLAAIVWLALAAPAFGQGPLTRAAALDEATSSNHELVALRRETVPDRLAALVRASQVLAEVRRAHAELVIARRTLELHVGQAPMLKEMADAAAIRPGAGEMARHDPAAMLLDIARLSAARITAQEQVKIAELRLNALLGRRLDASVETLAVPEAATIPEDAVAIALARDPQLAVASEARRDAVAVEIRRRVLEARVRVDAARERAAIMTTAVLPQVAIAFDSARAAYATNQGGFLEMMDAHHRQLEAGVENAVRSADYERALVALDIAIGETPERLARAVGSDRREN
jgi:outer membrane protein TolC